jgi:hypothetical protein
VSLESETVILEAQDGRGKMEFRGVRDFEQPVISILKELGGKAKPKEIYEQFAARYPNVVRDSYWNEIADSDLRWRDYINRCRFQILIPQGLLKRNSKKGTWELEQTGYTSGVIT